MGTERFCVGLTLALLAGGCAVGPNYRTPETAKPAGWSGLRPGATATQPTSGPAMSDAGPTTQEADLATWWKWLNDPILDALIAQAVESNLDLHVATARVLQARAQLDVTAAGFWPLVNVTGSYAYTGSSLNNTPKTTKPGNSLRNLLPSITAIPGIPGSGQPTVNVTPRSFTAGGGRHAGLVVQPGGLNIPNGPTSPAVALNPPALPSPQVLRQQNFFQAGFDATWELDVFGGIRRSIEAADDDLAASEETRRDVLVTLLSEVALDYVQLRGSQRRLTIAYENIDAQRDAVDLTESRYKAGFTNQLDVAQARAQLASTQSQVPLLETSIRQSIYQLSILLALPPGALVDELDKETPIPTTPPEVPMGLPSDLLRRRPDVRTAERQLAAQTARIGVATADLYPAFSLTGLVGPQITNIDHFFEGKSIAWSVGPSATWPIFDAGRIRANIRVQDALTEQALATYEKTVLTAFQDVENSLVAYVNEKVRHHSLSDAVAANQLAADLSTELYSRGLTAFLNVLVSLQALYASEDQLVQSETTTVTNLIALYKALGGGWEAPEQ
ncbi:MAG TPA: efflux transporter outer membrane subunit [Phycisphaerae bacterium]|nr:efflux transporter outer membrane subunit [Phycisphaerae bacterium]